MSQQRAERRVPPVGAADGVGGRGWEAGPVGGRVARAGPMAGPHGEGAPARRPRSRPPQEMRRGQAAFPRPRREPGAFRPDFVQAQPVFGEEVPTARGSRRGGFDVPNWVFMDVCRAREVAHDASWQACYPSVYLDYFTFIEDLFASVALSRLAAELGCDRLQDRE